MGELTLKFDQDTWTADLSNGTFADLKILQTDGPDDPPTEIQLQAVRIIEDMSVTQTTLTRHTIGMQPTNSRRC